MDKCYCVFWFPTIFHCEKKYRLDNPDDIIGPIPIEDGDDDNKLALTITRKKQENHNDNSCISNQQCEERYDLVFNLDNGKGDSFDTVFKCEDQTRNGFVVYSYDREKLKNEYWDHFVKSGKKSSDFEKDDRIDTLLLTFYHHAKLFYHEHETDGECDGKYTSYYYKEEKEDGSKVYLRELPSLYTKNNPVINWYLDQFERLIVKNAEDISEWARNWANQIDNYFNLKNKKETIETLNSTEELDQFTIEIQTRAAFPSKGNPGTSIEEKKAFLDNLWKVAYPKITENYYNALTELSSLCNDSLIEYTYCKTILESKYNDDYHHDNLFTENELDYYTKHPHYHPRLSEKDSRRKKAFNIRNSIRYIEDIKQKCDIWKNRITKTLIDEIFDLSSSHDVILNRLDTIIQKVNDQVEAVNELTEKVGTDVKYNTQLTEDATKLLHFGEKTNELNIELGKQSAKLGKLSFWISTVLGVLSVLLALFFGIRGSNIDCNCQSCNQQVQISSPTPHCPPHHIN